MTRTKAALGLSGRMGRSEYLRQVNRSTAFMGVMFPLCVEARIASMEPLAWFCGLCLTIALAMGCCATVRRLHDRGLSGKWCAAAAMAAALQFGLTMAGGSGLPADAVAVKVALSGVIVFVLSQTLIFEGSGERNRHGAPDGR